MIDWIRKGLLAGLGAGVITAEKMQGAMSRLVEQGRLTEQEASALLEELVEEAREPWEELQQSLSEAVRRAVEAAGVARAAELESLERRIAILEKRLERLEPGGSAEAPAEPRP